jgi:hypothetical protein
VFENRVLKKLCKLKKEEEKYTAGGNFITRTFKFVLISTIIKSGKIRLSGHIARTGEKRN